MIVRQMTTKASNVVIDTTPGFCMKFWSGAYNPLPTLRSVVARTPKEN